MVKKIRRKGNTGAGRAPLNISESVRDEIKRLLKSGVSIKEVARQLGINNATLTRKVKADPDMSAPPREKIMLDDDQIDYVHSQLVENVPLTRIAEELGMTRPTLTKRCRDIPKLNALLTPVGAMRVKKLSWTERDKIKKYARHMDITELAYTLGRDPARFKKLVEDDEEIRFFINESKTMGYQKSSRALEKEVEDGNINAIKYYENTRHGKVAVTQIKQETKTDFTGFDVSMMQELMKLSSEEQDRRIRELEADFNDDRSSERG